MVSSHLQEQSRREFLRLAAAGVGTASLSGWIPVLADAAADAARRTRTKAKSVILLYMAGGASHLDTFDLKPGAKGAGEFKPIPTSVPN